MLLPSFISLLITFFALSFKYCLEMNTEANIATRNEMTALDLAPVCSPAWSPKSVSTKFLPNIDEIKIQFITSCNRYDYPLLKAYKIVTNKEFDSENEIVLLVSGFSSSADNDDIIATFSRAYSCRGDVNFVNFDAGRFVRTSYTSAAFNTDALGMHVAKALKQLIAIIPVDNIHLIGHGLGANIVGAAGRYFQMITNKTLPHITGLDPAVSSFDDKSYLSGLFRGDADFVDVIHSSPGVYGKRDPMGDVDFYPGGFDLIPSGCVDILCAHARSWRYYAETIIPGNEENFMGTRCNSLCLVREGNCTGRKIPMGYAVPTDAKGNYFMEVRSMAPFGMNGGKDDVLKHNDCGVCQKIE